MWHFLRFAASPSLFNRYKLSLALIVGNDSENKTRILAQAVLPNERTDAFKFVMEKFVELCGGVHPGVGRECIKTVAFALYLLFGCNVRFAHG